MSSQGAVPVPGRRLELAVGATVAVQPDMSQQVFPGCHRRSGSES